ncbi:MAG: hypothetical protein EAY69_08265 [Cytophagales bacterium]|nr:MAG: hypothetical protein EAY69_08265 [Cytophagales bacterium]
MYQNFNTRKISFVLTIKILFGNVITQLGWGVVVFGQVFFISFAMQADFSDFYLGKNSPKTKGKIIEINNTNARINKRFIYEFHYEYEVKTKKLKAFSYSTNKDIQVNDIVNIEYMNNKPEYSRIEGMQQKTFPIYAISVVIITLVGITIVVINLLKQIKNIQLLKTGIITKGKFIKMEPTNVKVDNQSMMRLYFEFIDYLGKTQTVSADVLDLKGLQDEPEETIFYDKNKPSKAVLIDGLPSKIKLLSDNTFEDTNTAMAFVYLILPFLGLISILMAFV